jgi:hypothetical protein
MSGALATSRAAIGLGPTENRVRPIKLMIVDDSMVARAVLSRMIDADGSFEIAGIAGTRRTRSKRSARSWSTSSCSISKCLVSVGSRRFRAFSRRPKARRS